MRNEIQMSIKEKMNICPRCDNFIEHLEVETIITKVGMYDGSQYEDELETNKTIHFVCPACDNVLFDNPLKAFSFLNKVR